VDSRHSPKGLQSFVEKKSEVPEVVVGERTAVKKMGDAKKGGEKMGTNMRGAAEGCVISPEPKPPRLCYD